MSESTCGRVIGATDRHRLSTLEWEAWSDIDFIATGIVDGPRSCNALTTDNYRNSVRGVVHRIIKNSTLHVVFVVNLPPPYLAPLPMT